MIAPSQGPAADPLLAELLGPLLPQSRVSASGRSCRLDDPTPMRATRGGDDAGLLARLFARYGWRAVCLDDTRALETGAGDRLGAPLDDGDLRWSWRSLDLPAATRLAASAEGGWAMAFASDAPAELLVPVPLIVPVQHAESHADGLGAEVLLLAEVDDEFRVLALGRRADPAGADPAVPGPPTSARRRSSSPPAR